MMEIPEWDIKRIKKNIAEMKEKERQMDRDPKIRLQRKLMGNYIKHSRVLSSVDTEIFCPECGSDWKGLGWICCKTNIQDAEASTHDKFHMRYLPKKQLQEIKKEIEELLNDDT